MMTSLERWIFNSLVIDIVGSTIDSEILGKAIVRFLFVYVDENIDMQKAKRNTRVILPSVQMDSIQRIPQTVSYEPHLCQTPRIQIIIPFRVTLSRFQSHRYRGGRKWFGGFIYYYSMW